MDGLFVFRSQTQWNYFYFFIFSMCMCMCVCFFFAIRNKLKLVEVNWPFVFSFSFELSFFFSFVSEKINAGKNDVIIKPLNFLTLSLSNANDVWLYFKNSVEIFDWAIIASLESGLCQSWRIMYFIIKQLKWREEQLIANKTVKPNGNGSSG